MNFLTVTINCQPINQGLKLVLNTEKIRKNRIQNGKNENRYSRPKPKSIKNEHRYSVTRPKSKNYEYWIRNRKKRFLVSSPTIELIRTTNSRSLVCMTGNCHVPRYDYYRDRALHILIIIRVSPRPNDDNWEGEGWWFRPL